jgi:DNA-binding MarR family transcriptional regulator
MVKQMEAKGFLKRGQEPGDLRKFRLLLSASGRRAIVKGRAAIVVAFGTRLARLGPAEIASLEQIIERLSNTEAR